MKDAVGGPLTTHFLIKKTNQDKLYIIFKGTYRRFLIDQLW